MERVQAPGDVVELELRLDDLQLAIDREQAEALDFVL